MLSINYANPRCICIGPDDFVYVCDGENKCVSVFKARGGFVTIFGQFMSPGGIVVDVDSFVYVAERIPEGRILASVFAVWSLCESWAY